MANLCDLAGKVENLALHSSVLATCYKDEDVTSKLLSWDLAYSELLIRSVTLWPKL